MRAKRIARQIAGWIIAAVIIFFLFRTVYIHRGELVAWQWRINWHRIILSAVMLGGAYLCSSQAWRTIIDGFGYRIRLSESFRVVYLANLGRYIPGKIWQVIGMVGLAKEINIPAQISLASFALVQAYALPASFMIVILSLGYSHSLDSLAVYRDILYAFMAIVLIVFLILFLKPNGLNRALNWILRLFKREPVHYAPGIANRTAILCWYLITWILFGLSFHYFLAALIDKGGPGIIFSSGAYIAAYNIGYISFLSPGGLGVREGVISALLAPYLTGPIAASIALIHRLWITIAEAIISLLALLTYKIKS
jgi:uncharacterized membrane protein YbhN (UPF0104 family)